MKITVTQQHVDRGVRSNCCHCPVSLAVQEALPQYGCSVASWTDCIITGDDTKYATPRAAAQFIADFDAGRPVKPFSFELE